MRWECAAKTLWVIANCRPEGRLFCDYPEAGQRRARAAGLAGFGSGFYPSAGSNPPRLFTAGSRLALPASVLRLRRRVLRATTALGHELVEFGFVLCVTQAVEKFLEFALFFLEPAQCLGTVLVEGTVAARG